MPLKPKKYVATMGHNSTTPHNHGLVDITDDGYIGDTPIEDYGMYIVQDEPFPSDNAALFECFMALIKQQG